MCVTLSRGCQIICIQEMLCLVTNWLVIRIDIEQSWGQNTTLWQTVVLPPPITGLPLMGNVEHPVVQHGFDDCSEFEVPCYFVYLLAQQVMVYCVTCSCKIHKDYARYLLQFKAIFDVLGDIGDLTGATFTLMEASLLRDEFLINRILHPVEQQPLEQFVQRHRRDIGLQRFLLLWSFPGFRMVTTFDFSQSSGILVVLTTLLQRFVNHIAPAGPIFLSYSLYMPSTLAALPFFSIFIAPATSRIEKGAARWSTSSYSALSILHFRTFTGGYPFSTSWLAISFGVTLEINGLLDFSPLRRFTSFHALELSLARSSSSTRLIYLSFHSSASIAISSLRFSVVESANGSELKHW